jgi:hypothetical protein
MANTIQRYNALGVLIDDTWLSGVQSVERPTSIENSSPNDTGRIQSSNVFISPNNNIDITITRVIGDIAQFFYQPASLTNYASTFLLANSNIGMSSWDSLKEYKVQVIWGSDDDAYLGANASNYVSLDTFEYCLLTGISYSISDRGIINETVNLTTRNQTVTSDSSLGALSLPSFPETLNPLRSHNIEIGSCVFPTILTSIFDNSWNDTNGRDSEHGKYALTSIEMTLSIDYGELSDQGRPRGSVTASEQNKWRFVSNTTVECAITGIARQSDFTKAVSDENFSTYPSPDYQLKIVGLLGTDYYVWDFGSKNFISSYTTPLATAPDGRSEFSMTFSNRRHDFVPYVNSSVLNLIQSGTY